MKSPSSRSLREVHNDFGTEERCLAYLEKMRWPNGVRCLKCDSDKISRFTTQETTRERKNRKTGQITTATIPARQLYSCMNPECRHVFSATAGTVFHDTHLGLPLWLTAVALM